MTDAAATQNAAPPDAAGQPAARVTTRSRLLRFALAAACLAADLWTKHIVFYPHVLERGFREGEVVGHPTTWEWARTTWWRTILVYNPGVTFGKLADVAPWVKSILTSAVIAWMAWKLWTLPRGRPAQALSLAMIVGGAVGNLYDRTLRPVIELDTRPGVRDFLDWYLPEGSALHREFAARDWPTHWYTSNVADVMIVCGVIVLAWCLLREDDGKAAPKEPAAA